MSNPEANLATHVDIYQTFVNTVADYFDEEGNLQAEEAWEAMLPLRSRFEEYCSKEEVALLGIAAVRDTTRKAQKMVAFRELFPGVSPAGMWSLL